MQKQGGGESRHLGKVESDARGRPNQILRGGGNGCWGRKTGTARWKTGDSPWGVGEVCRGGEKNFSPFVSV